MSERQVLKSIFNSGSWEQQQNLSIRPVSLQTFSEAWRSAIAVDTWAPTLWYRRLSICGTLLGGEGSCRRHLNDQHKDKVNLAAAKEYLKTATITKAQTVFNGPRLLYFPVTILTKLGNAPMQRTSIQQFLRERLKEHVAQGDSLALEDKSRNALTRDLNLAQFLKSRDLTCQDAYAFMKVLDDRISRNLSKYIKAYFKHFKNLLSPIQENFKRFVRLKDLVGEASFDLFITEESQKTYAQYIVRFIFCASRVHQSTTRCPVDVPTDIGIYSSGLI